MSDELTCPVCGRPLEKPPEGRVKLDSDLWRIRFAFRVVAGLNFAFAALVVMKGDWLQLAINVVVGALCAVMAISVATSQQTRNATMKTLRECREAMAKLEDLRQ
jgi:hypothetical protein